MHQVAGAAQTPPPGGIPCGEDMMRMEKTVQTTAMTALEHHMAVDDEDCQSNSAAQAPANIGHSPAGRPERGESLTRINA